MFLRHYIARKNARIMYKSLLGFMRLQSTVVIGCMNVSTWRLQSGSVFVSLGETFRRERRNDPPRKRI